MPSASSRHRYRQFVEDYRHGRLDDSPPKTGSDTSPGDKSSNGARRYSHVRDYVRWLRPHRAGVAIFSLLALIAAGLQMIDPLSEVEIEDAARRANAHEFIVKLPEQYETFVARR